MTEINPIILGMVAEKLDRLGLNYAFASGSIVGSLLDNAEFSPVRPTDDVDVILEVLTTQRYSDIEAKLRSIGFAHDTRQDATMCRWRLRDLTVDIMPTDGASLGLNTAWFAEALMSATARRIGRFSLRVISPVAFIATKLAAFADRGKGDYFASHDIEDLMTVIDGRAGIVAEIAAGPVPLRNYIVSTLQGINQASAFQEAIPGYLASDDASQQRLPQLRMKLKAIIRLMG